jgi:hypothetical protein
MLPSENAGINNAVYSFSFMSVLAILVYQINII